MRNDEQRAGQRRERAGRADPAHRGRRARAGGRRGRLGGRRRRRPRAGAQVARAPPRGAARGRRADDVSDHACHGVPRLEKAGFAAAHAASA
jgi:hypothetical protein